MSGTTSKGKLACLAAAIPIGAALIAAPVQARGGGWGGHGGSWHGAGMAWHGAGVGWRGAGVGWRGAAWHGRFFPHPGFAFFPHRRFGPFFGVYAGGYGSCWSWVPTAFGWRYVWTCGPYGYGFY
jgi:hypothetical protein